MTLETISTGDEIIRGHSTDTNAPWLAARLGREGIFRRFHTLVGDDLDGLASAFRTAADRSDLVLVTGGLGPTEDDWTRRAAAKALGVGTVFRKDLWEALVLRFATLKREITESQKLQAYIPEGATVIPNRLGTAPGFSIELSGARLHFLSGVPREMEVMFTEHVLPEILAARPPSAADHRVIPTFGKAEAFVNDALGDVLLRTDASVGMTADYGTIRVTIQTVGEGSAERADGIEREVRLRLGGLVLEAESVEASVATLLSRRGLTLGVAESCTGGRIATQLTGVPGVSAVFLGGVVAYDNGVKERLLSVPRELLLEHGAVSAPVAVAMAEGARRVLGTDLAVATTGIAGPTGGTPEKPVGIVHLALATPGGTEHREVRLPGDREFVRRFSANIALNLVRRWLRKP
jgi:nicotinamide-nucleotide amidase